MLELIAGVAIGGLFGVVVWFMNKGSVTEVKESLNAIRTDYEAQQLEAALQKEALSRSETEVFQLENTISLLEDSLDSVTTEAKHQKGRAQSAHTSKGQLLEKWTPFCDVEGIEPHWRPQDWSFFGNPLDYIVWDWKKDKETNDKEGKIVFIDVKAANSQLSTKQRRIRDLIRKKAVEWREIRLN